MNPILSLRSWRSAYLKANPDVARAGVDPLIHYLRRGRFEGRGAPWVSRTAARDATRAAFSSISSEALDLECAEGRNYFQRFSFGFDPADAPGGQLVDAIEDLASRSLALNVDRINPDVSIVIPVYGQTHFALGCLDSLANHRSRFSVEIIVADDASPAPSQAQRLAAIPWIRYKRREVNGGFIDTCNEAAAMARGRFVVFLNSDTRVAAGWLDELIGSFELFPNAGLIGSKLFNGDGSLQEAGGIYWSDGSAWNYGLNDDPNHPKYCFARQVDYVSGAAIAVPTDLWRRMGGFDAAYRPAYCEDADLAFRLREEGFETWFQPLSCVIHYEGKTHGRNLNAGGKAHQQIHMRRLAERWSHRLAAHRPNGQEPDREANRTARDRILVLDAVTPTPDRDSGSFITVRMLRGLQRLGYAVTFVPQHNYLYFGEYTSALQRSGVECLHLPYFRTISEVLDYRTDFDVVLGYRVTVLGSLYDEIRHRLPAARILFHNVDLHFLREEREAALLGSRSKKIAAAITRASEFELIAKVDCTIVHTPVEKQIIQESVAVDNIIEFPYIAELHPTKIPFENRYDIMFLGGFVHPPNTDAVLHFLQTVWPLLETRLDERARFVIVGAEPPADIQSFAGDRIVVTGHVQDLQPYFDRARVFVAPIRYGAGIKGKVIQSLCYGTPSVVSSIAAEGIGLISGQETMIADEPAAFAQCVMNAYTDPQLWHSLQAAGYKFVQENFSWSRSLDLCRKALDTADATWLERHEAALRARLEHLTASSS